MYLAQNGQICLLRHKTTINKSINNSRHVLSVLKLILRSTVMRFQMGADNDGHGTCYGVIKLLQVKSVAKCAIF